ncbi:MAG: hypothetical protein VX075_06330, partial [Pseudomonadota bacterium]|nr:hypothetical protein [Pseudomonadota bacterium]
LTSERCGCCNCDLDAWSDHGYRNRGEKETNLRTFKYQGPSDLQFQNSSKRVQTGVLDISVCDVVGP